MRLALACLFAILCARLWAQQPPSHAAWTTLLQRHVTAEGWVDYEGFRRDSQALNAYLRTLEAAPPLASAWTTREIKAYWINAYNAYTIALVLRHYPVESIKDIQRGLPFVNSVWDIKFIVLGGQTYDLNAIEHNILRKRFRDARLHAALNCASVSCPALRREAYVPERLDAQLDDAMRRFVNDPLRNRIGPDDAQVSEIFKWYSGDFKRDAGSVRAFLNRFSAVPLAEKTNLRYLDYDWSLNGLR
jgi:hypothetical protein